MHETRAENVLIATFSGKNVMVHKHGWDNTINFFYLFPCLPIKSLKGTVTFTKVTLK
jgi:hypothetical protein